MAAELPPTMPIFENPRKLKIPAAIDINYI